MIDKFTDPHLILGIVEIVVLIIGFTYAVRQLRISVENRNVDFVIDAEGQIDPLFLEVAENGKEVARKFLPGLLSDVADEDVVPLLYTYYAYRHTSRIYYLLTDDDITLGMKEKERSDMLHTWISELEKYNLNYIERIHSYGSETGEFNHRFITACTEWLDKKNAQKKLVEH